MKQTLLVLSYVAKFAGLISGLGYIPGVSPATGILIFGFASILKDTVNRVGDLLDDGVANNSFKLLPFCIAIGLACSAITGCAALPFLISAAPSLLQAVEPMIQNAVNKPATVAKVQTALDRLQDVNNGQFPTELEINAALATAGKQALTDAEYNAIAQALTPAFQQLVTSIQANGGDPATVKAEVNNAIVTAQLTLAGK